jgi:hypothetical protein
MLPSDIALDTLRYEIKGHPEIEGFSLEPSFPPGSPPILALQVPELTVDSAELVRDIYMRCRQWVTLGGYRIGTLATVLDPG